jgi:photosystem II stability/assembly factor-like uncharacterized protein
MSPSLTISRPFVLLLILAAASIVPASSSGAAARETRHAIAGNRLQALEWRSIGPYRGGRVTAVAGVAGQPLTYYFGATGGGVWKTTDAGVTWRNVSDHFLGTGSVGAVAVAESDPNVVYVGMGESCIRGNVSHGDGVYRSTDGGESWTHMGLRDSRQIGRIRVHPRDPEQVYVAALGHAFGENSERGVYRSRDGGKTWRQVLAVDARTGAVDLALDPENPRILYAAFWQARRTPWSFESGGPGSGLYQSSDEGDSWRRLEGGGLPKGPWGRVGVSISDSKPERVWALIEAEEGGLFRSDDRGRTWRRTSDDRRLRQRAWYYTHVHADPQNADAVWVLNVQLLRSIDGGRSFTPVSAPHGDHHDMWIAADDSRRLINGNDGGANVSFDGGRSWSRQDNQPTGQFYHVIADDRFPYHVYGAQQDNSTVAIASRTSSAGIGPEHWYPVGGCESGFIAPKPGQPDVVYAGCYGGTITRYDHRTRTIRNVTVYPENPMGWGAEGMKYRFQWTFPIVASPHDPNTLYAAGNVLFRSRDEGQSWEAISPDLTRNDPAKLGPSGGPITKDNTSVEYYCTVFAFAESPLTPGLLWAGSDDGRVHVSRNGGGSWAEVTPRGLPPWTLVSQIDPSPHDPATAYLAVNRYKLDDYQPQAYVTRDYGKSWRRISDGLPPTAFVRVVREDPAQKGLLYAGTELGVFFSIDQGQRWQPLRMQPPLGAGSVPPGTAPEAGLLPIVPITDLVVKEQDVVVSTQGRGFWILDDVSPLRQMAARHVAAPARLFTPAPSYRFGGGRGGAGRGLNPPTGAVVYYELSRPPTEGQEVRLEFRDRAGKTIRTFTSKAATTETERVETDAGEGGPAAPPAPPKVPIQVGLNRFVWDLRHAEARRFPGMILWGGGLQGPVAVPGTYEVRLTALGTTSADSLEVRRDPRLEGDLADDQAKFDLLTAIRNKLDETHAAIVRLREVREQVKASATRAAKDTAIAAAAERLAKRLTAVEEALYQTRNRSSQDPLNYPIRLNNKLSALAGTVSGTEGRPTTQQEEVYQDLSSRIDRELTSLRQLLQEDVSAFNRLMREREVPSVVVKDQTFEPPPAP